MRATRSGRDIAVTSGFKATRYILSHPGLHQPCGRKDLTTYGLWLSIYVRPGTTSQDTHTGRLVVTNQPYICTRNIVSPVSSSSTPADAHTQDHKSRCIDAHMLRMLRVLAPPSIWAGRIGGSYFLPSVLTLLIDSDLARGFSATAHTRASYNLDCRHACAQLVQLLGSPV